MASALTEIVFDCADPKLVAEFWSQVLGWEVQAEDAYYWMSASGDYTSRPFLVFGQVPETKTVKNRIHIDVNPHGCDQAEELERLLAIGATRADVGQTDVAWIVLADPEGNEFCLLNRRTD